MTLEITDARSWHMAGAVPAHPAGIHPGESVHWRAVSGRYINCSGGMSSCRTTSTSVTTKRKSARDVSVSGSYDSAAWRGTATSTGSNAMGATICSRGRGLRSTLNVSSPPSPHVKIALVPRAIATFARRHRTRRGSPGPRLALFRRVAGTHAAIPQQNHEFGPFGTSTLAPTRRRSSAQREEFSTIGRFAYIPRPRSVLARLVRIINTAVLGVPPSR